MRNFKFICLIVVLVLVIGCFVGCQQAPAAQRPIENEDGTLADWMKAEIEKLYHDHAHPTYTFDDPSTFGITEQIMAMCLFLKEQDTSLWVRSL